MKRLLALILLLLCASVMADPHQVTWVAPSDPSFTEYRVQVGKCGGPWAWSNRTTGKQFTSASVDIPHDGNSWGVLVVAIYPDRTMPFAEVCKSYAPTPLVVTLAAEPRQVASGGSVVLTWNSPGAVRCNAISHPTASSSGPTPLWTGEKPPAGTDTVTIMAETLFVLNCQNTLNEWLGHASVIVRLTPVLPPPTAVTVQ